MGVTSAARKHLYLSEESPIVDKTNRHHIQFPTDTSYITPGGALENEQKQNFYEKEYKTVQ